MKLQAAYDLLKNAFESGRPAHGYLIVAPPRGSGQALAERILQYLFCESDDKPCGACRACLRVGEHRHSDLLWMEPQKKSRIISVDEVRAMQSRVFQTSFEGGWRAVVIAGADRLRDAAANAFLKTLEEPPPKCVFLLLSDSPQSLLPTILSRCQSVTVDGLADGGSAALPMDVQERLVQILAMDASGSAVASLAQASLLKKLLKEVRTAAEESEAEDADEDEGEDADVRDARIAARCREVQSGILTMAMAWYRDIVMLLCGADDVVYNKAHIDVLRKHAARITLQDAMKNVRHVEDMNRRLERNVADAAVFGLGFASIR